MIDIVKHYTAKVDTLRQDLLAEREAAMNDILGDIHKYTISIPSTTFEGASSPVE
jgi:hypothetical protein